MEISEMIKIIIGNALASVAVQAVCAKNAADTLDEIEKSKNETTDKIIEFLSRNESIKN